MITSPVARRCYKFIMHYATDRPEVPKVVSVVEVIDCEL